MKFLCSFSLGQVPTRKRHILILAQQIFYSLKVRKRGARKRCKICSNWTAKTPEGSLLLLWTYFTHFSIVSNANIELVKCLLRVRKFFRISSKLFCIITFGKTLKDMGHGIFFWKKYTFCLLDCLLLTAQRVPQEIYGDSLLLTAQRVPQTILILTIAIFQNNADNKYLKKGGTESLNKCPPPWLGDKENFEIYKL